MALCNVRIVVESRSHSDDRVGFAREKMQACMVGSLVICMPLRVICGGVDVVNKFVGFMASQARQASKLAEDCELHMNDIQWQ